MTFKREAWLRFLLPLIGFALLDVAVPAHAERIKDLVSIQGVRNNALWYG